MEQFQHNKNRTFTIEGKKTMKKRAILFDFDGVLFPTEKFRAQAHVATVYRFGGKVQPDFYALIQGVGKPYEEVRRMFIQASGIQVVQERYTEVFQEILAHLYREIQPIPGILKILGRLRKNGHTLAVVSSSNAQEVYPLLEMARMQKWFAAVVTGDRVLRKKPAPDLYLLALQELGVSAKDAIAVEDSESGLQSASEAGIQTIAFRTAEELSETLGGEDNDGCKETVESGTGDQPRNQGDQ